MPFLLRSDLTDSNKTVIQEDSARVADLLCKMDFGDHNMLIYPDRNTLHDVYCSHIKKSLEKNEKAVVMLSHYENSSSVRYALKEVDILVEKHEADHSLILLDADSVIFKASMDTFIQYMKGLEELALKDGKKGIDIVIDMGSFYHMKKGDEILKYEHACNRTTAGSKSSILCCYHVSDLQRVDNESIKEIQSCHSKSFIINGEK
jgi:hypothetical protein